MPKLVQNAIKVRFATKLTPEFEEFRNACGMIFVERFKGILSNHVNISKLPQNVKDDLRERMFPLGLTLQLMKMSKLKTLEAQIKYFGGNTNNRTSFPFEILYRKKIYIYSRLENYLQPTTIKTQRIQCHKIECLH